jgi:hypothetical protein
MTAEGQWTKGKLSGKVVIKAPDGGYYEGDFKNNTRHGKGVYTYPDMTIYDGLWSQGKFHDMEDNISRVKWIDGSEYTGTFKGGRYWIGTYTGKKGKPVEINRDKNP